MENGSTAIFLLTIFKVVSKMAENLNSTFNRKDFRTKNREFDLSFDTLYIENSEFIDQLSIVGEVKNLDPSKPGYSFIFNSSKDRTYLNILRDWPRSENGIIELRELESEFGRVWIEMGLNNRRIIATHISLLPILLKIRFPDNFKAVETEMTAKTPIERLSKEEIYQMYRDAILYGVRQEKIAAEFQDAIEARENEFQNALETRENEFQNALATRETEFQNAIEARETEFQKVLKAKDAEIEALRLKLKEFEK